MARYKKQSPPEKTWTFEEIQEYTRLCAEDGMWHDVSIGKTLSAWYILLKDKVLISKNEYQLLLDHLHDKSL